jgi:BolA family transcriptional regulator, general stress-responsive regulator
MQNKERVEKIRLCLETKLKPIQLEITDDSEQHRGHAGAKSGKGHFTVRIASDQFTNLATIQCHRLINDALKPLFITDIHALSIKIIRE